MLNLNLLVMVWICQCEDSHILPILQNSGNLFQDKTKDKTKASPERLACCVDYTGKFSNFFGDLEKLDRFSQSVENELNRIVSEEDGSREDLRILSKKRPI